MKKKFLALLSVMALGASLLAGCGSTASETASTEGTEAATEAATEATETADADDTSSEGSTLIYGSNDYTRINPAIDEHGEINLLLFDGLTAHDADNNVVPGLAESWDIDDENNTYTFHIREGVKWHDGETFTAEDVKFTIEAIMNPDNESEIASNYEEVADITVVDDNTVTFTLSEKNVAFLEYMTIGILPKHLLDGKDMQNDPYFKSPVGTGPYKFSEWVEGQSITLEANEDYYKGAPNIQTIVFKIVDDDNAKALQLQSGEINFAKITPKDTQAIASNDGFYVYNMKTSDYRGIMYNFNNDFWKENADIIPAISYGIDRQAMVDAVLLGDGIVAYGPLQRNVYNDESTNLYDYNPEKAVEIIEAAGWTMGDDGIYEKDGQKLSFTVTCKEGDQVRADLAAIATQQLAEIGVDCKSEIKSKIDWAGQDAFLIGWGSPFDADDHTWKVFGTDKGANYNAYSDAIVDEALKNARQTDDPEERAKYYSEFLNEMNANPAYTFFCYVDVDYVSNVSINGITPDTILGHHGVGIFWNVEEWTLD
ncbi:MAG: ABC transporter substrate-binding protein [Lachnospiraceae bacterium]|nr:ABC transporter substrate-binding protein [Lachnospiraceae bacterium]